MGHSWSLLLKAPVLRLPDTTISNLPSTSHQLADGMSLRGFVARYSSQDSGDEYDDDARSPYDDESASQDELYEVRESTGAAARASPTVPAVIVLKSANFPRRNLSYVAEPADPHKLMPLVLLGVRFSRRARRPRLLLLLYVHHAANPPAFRIFGLSLGRVDTAAHQHSGSGA